MLHTQKKLCNWPISLCRLLVFPVWTICISGNRNQYLLAPPEQKLSERNLSVPIKQKKWNFDPGSIACQVSTSTPEKYSSLDLRHRLFQQGASPSICKDTNQGAKKCWDVVIHDPQIIWQFVCFCSGPATNDKQFVPKTFWVLFDLNKYRKAFDNFQNWEKWKWLWSHTKSNQKQRSKSKRQKCNKARLHKIENTMQSNRNAMKQNYSLSQLMLLWFEYALKIKICVFL